MDFFFPTKQRVNSCVFLHSFPQIESDVSSAVAFELCTLFFFWMFFLFGRISGGFCTLDIFLPPDVHPCVGARPVNKQPAATEAQALIATAAHRADEPCRGTGSSCPLLWCKLHAEEACQTCVTVGL